MSCVNKGITRTGGFYLSCLSSSDTGRPEETWTAGNRDSEYLAGGDFYQLSLYLSISYCDICYLCYLFQVFNLLQMNRLQ